MELHKRMNIKNDQKKIKANLRLIDVPKFREVVKSRGIESFYLANKSDGNIRKTQYSFKVNHSYFISLLHHYFGSEVLFHKI